MTHAAFTEVTYHEPFRPQFHYTPQHFWMNDPNGLVFYDGEFHLFYQYNPQANQWGHISWGHAVSRDLMHWEELPVALPEHGGAMCFSGSAVVDWQNTSGFGQGGKPALVVIYTADHGGKHQEQCLAFSNDRGRTWTFYEGNPVLDPGLKDFRDPKVFWHQPTQRWIMVVSLPTKHKVSFYASPDFKHWSHLDDFGPAGATGGVWECPDLFPLSIEGEKGKAKWVLIVNLNPGGVAGGSGCQYFVGDFDGKHFVSSSSSIRADWADFGPDFYAAVSWSDIPSADGRRILVGWMSNWNYCTQVPTSPWRGTMAVPRALSLRRTPEGLRLIQQPVAEIALLRQASPRRFEGGTFAQGTEWLASQKDLPALLEVRIEFSGMTTASRFTVNVQTGDNELTSVGCDALAGKITVDRTRSGHSDFYAGFASRYSAPLRVSDGRCMLRLLLDASSLEVFAQDGETVLTTLIFPAGTARHLSLGTSESSAPAIRGITIEGIASALSATESPTAR